MRGKHRHAAVPSSPPPPEDRSWAARAEGLKRERPAQLAMVFALFAFMAMLAGWIAVLIAPGGNIRFNPVFWLLAAPLMVWLWNLQSYRTWAVNTLWLVLMLAPCLALLALFVAPAMRQSALLDGGSFYLDTPLAMLVILGLTTALAAAGLVALRRSSLPGGTRPASYVAPGTAIPDVQHLSGQGRSVLMLGSLPFSGTLINGMFFAVVATMEPIGPAGMIWPGALVGILVLTVGTLVFRGGLRLTRRRPGAVADLRRGWGLGMVCTVAALAGLWAWPTILTLKLGFSCFMVPLALAAAWCGRAALRGLPQAALEP